MVTNFFGTFTPASASPAAQQLGRNPTPIATPTSAKSTTGCSACSGSSAKPAVPVTQASATPQYRPLPEYSIFAANPRLSSLYDSPVSRIATPSSHWMMQPAIGTTTKAPCDCDGSGKCGCGCGGNCGDPLVSDEKGYSIPGLNPASTLDRKSASAQDVVAENDLLISASNRGFEIDVPQALGGRLILPFDSSPKAEMSRTHPSILGDYSFSPKKAGIAQLTCRYPTAAVEAIIAESDGKGKVSVKILDTARSKIVLDFTYRYEGSAWRLNGSGPSIPDRANLYTFIFQAWTILHVIRQLFVTQGGFSYAADGQLNSSIPTSFSAGEVSPNPDLGGDYSQKRSSGVKNKPSGNQLDGKEDGDGFAKKRGAIVVDKPNRRSPQIGDVDCTDNHMCIDHDLVCSFPGVPIPIIGPTGIVAAGALDKQINTSLIFLGIPCLPPLEFSIGDCCLKHDIETWCSRDFSEKSAADFQVAKCIADKLKDALIDAFTKNLFVIICMIGVLVLEPLLFVDIIVDSIGLASFS